MRLSYHRYFQDLVQEHPTSIQENSLHSTQDPDRKRCTSWQDHAAQTYEGSVKETSDILDRILVLLLAMILIDVRN